MKQPNSRANLDKAIQRIADGDRDTYIGIRAVIANTVVGQMLPDGAVKGGSSIKLRLGDAGTRFTTDLDVARASALEDYTDALQESLRTGWNGFTGRIVAGRQAHPKDVPSEYVMAPFEVKLSYLGKPWLTVKLEIGHDEIGDADRPDWGISPDIVALFGKVGLPRPEPVPLMPLHHQASQKIHALTEPGSRRAHDLIDLQLIDATGHLDRLATLEVCERLFAYRKKQPWPSPVVALEGWRAAYDEQRRGLDVLDDVDDAVAWANALIDDIAHADSSEDRFARAFPRSEAELEEMLAASEVTPLSECIPMSDGAAQVRESMPKR